jgi:hypothetical protein
MIIGLSLLNNIFALHIEPQNYPKTIPMCYAKHRKVYILALKKLLTTKNKYHIGNEDMTLWAHCHGSNKVTLTKIIAVCQKRSGP